jgi:hypothetical protein
LDLVKGVALAVRETSFLALDRQTRTLYLIRLTGELMMEVTPKVMALAVRQTRILALDRQTDPWVMVWEIGGLEEEESRAAGISQTHSGDKCLPILSMVR